MDTSVAAPEQTTWRGEGGRGEGGLFDFFYALLALFRIWVIYLNVISPIKDARSK